METKFVINNHKRSPTIYIYNHSNESSSSSIKIIKLEDFIKKSTDKCPYEKITNRFKKNNIKKKSNIIEPLNRIVGFEIK